MAMTFSQQIYQNLKSKLSFKLSIKYFVWQCICQRSPMMPFKQTLRREDVLERFSLLACRCRCDEMNVVKHSLSS